MDAAAAAAAERTLALNVHSQRQLIADKHGREEAPILDVRERNRRFGELSELGKQANRHRNTKWPMQNALAEWGCPRVVGIGVDRVAVAGEFSKRTEVRFGDAPASAHILAAYNNVFEI